MRPPLGRARQRGLWVAPRAAWRIAVGPDEKLVNAVVHTTRASKSGPYALTIALISFRKIAAWGDWRW